MLSLQVIVLDHSHDLTGLLLSSPHSVILPEVVAHQLGVRVEARPGAAALLQDLVDVCVARSGSQLVLEQPLLSCSTVGFDLLRRSALVEEDCGGVSGGLVD